MNTKTYVMIFSLTDIETCAPIDEPRIAAITDGTASLKFTSLFFINLSVASVVPHVDDILFVAIAACGGNPAIKYAGREISPPPPPIASTNPARNKNGQIIRNIFSVISINSSLIR